MPTFNSIIESFIHSDIHFFNWLFFLLLIYSVFVYFTFIYLHLITFWFTLSTIFVTILCIVNLRYWRDYWFYGVINFLIPEVVTGYI